MMRRTAWLAVLGCALLCGCSKSDVVTRYPVEVHVTLDGAPLKKGTVLLKPTDASLGADGGDLVDGVARMQATPGAKRVEITAYKETGEKMDNRPLYAEIELPAEYNTESTLTADVKANGNNRAEFKLTSKK